MARLGGHYEVARLLQALHWAADKDRHDNHKLLQTALQEEATAIEREGMAREKHYRAVKAYDAWQERNSVSNHSHVEPGACEFRLEQRGRLDVPGTSSCSSCGHSAAARGKGRASSRPAVRPLCITPFQADKNLTHIGRPGHIDPYSNYPTQEHRGYSRCGTPSRAGSAGGSQRKKQLVGIRRSARVHRTKLGARGTEVQESRSVTAVGLEPVEHHCQGHLEGELSEKNSGVTEANEEEEEDGLGSPGELMFHEVQQQSLKALPDAMYLQELLGSPSPSLQPPSAATSRARDRRLSLSQINHRHNVYRGKMQRRLSLGAIPEGRMVHQYHKEVTEEDMLGSVLWSSVAWQVALASHRQCSSAPPSPVSDAQRSILNARILGRLGTAADEERELVYSDDSSSEEEEEEEEEGRLVPRPDTPLPFLAYSSPSSSSHSLSSPSSPRLTPPPNPLEDCHLSSDVIVSSADTPPDTVTSSVNTPLDTVTSSVDTPPDTVTSSVDTPPDTVPSSVDTPLDTVTSSVDTPPDTVPSSVDTPPDTVASSVGSPPGKVRSSPNVLEHPSSKVWQERCDVSCPTTRGTSLYVTGGQILPASRPSQPRSRSATPRTSPTKDSSTSSGVRGRASHLRSQSSAVIRGTSSAVRLSSRRTQSSTALLPGSTPEGRVAVRPTLMQFGGGLVAVTAGLR